MTKTQARDHVAALLDGMAGVVVRTKGGERLPVSRLPVTIEVGALDEVLDHLPGDGWAHLRSLRAGAVNVRSTEIPGLWLEAARDALTDAPAKAPKEDSHGA